ncbi:hypothetical protein AB0J21_00975 [Streptomyces sp. NPDC049954]|uniref:hypothetical protein n=1 Tax=Streptomyces sp. NPDC049954 TaxID=3155779 RepID=UPI00342FF705
MRISHRRPAAVAVLAAALLTLSACGSDHDDKDSAKGAATSAPAAGEESGGPDEKAADQPAANAASAQPKPTGSVVSDDGLKPATGSFTKKEKKYLSGRVPKDVDPASVLQTGQEACQRIELTAQHDKDAVVGALITGEIPDAPAAVEQLCPEQQPLLDRARQGFSDGTRRSPAAGTYRALTADTSSCTWQALGEGGKVLASGPPQGQKPAKVTADIPAGTAKFVSTGCYAWLPV